MLDELRDKFDSGEDLSSEEVEWLLNETERLQAILDQMESRRRKHYD